MKVLKEEIKNITKCLNKQEAIQYIKLVKSMLSIVIRNEGGINNIAQLFKSEIYKFEIGNSLDWSIDKNIEVEKYISSIIKTPINIEVFKDNLKNIIKKIIESHAKHIEIIDNLMSIILSILDKSFIPNKYNNMTLADKIKIAKDLNDTDINFMLSFINKETRNKECHSDWRFSDKKNEYGIYYYNRAGIMKYKGYKRLYKEYINSLLFILTFVLLFNLTVKSLHSDNVSEYIENLFQEIVIFLNIKK